MTRKLPEWHGATLDTPIPPRVKLRIFESQSGKCKSCGREIFGRLCPPQADHKMAIVNGGENRENNIQILCRECHVEKTSNDLSEKSESRRVRMKHTGIKARKGRSMIGTKASGWKHKMNGCWERRK